MNEFELHRPATLDAALTLLSDLGEDARPIAGGTALILLMKQRLVQPEALVSLAGIPELNQIRIDGDLLRIGAMTPHRKVELSPEVAAFAPLIPETYRHVASIRVRNQATVGGGLVHADPAQDPPAALLVLDAQVRLVGPSGERNVPLTEFFADYYETALEPGELLAEVLVPRVKPGSGSAYLKFLPRTVDDYATAAAAASCRLEDGVLHDVRLAFIAAGPTPLRATNVEAALEGKAPDKAALAEAAELARDIVDPLDDVRGSAEYKREMSVVFARRALEAAAKRAGAA